MNLKNKLFSLFVISLSLQFTIANDKVIILHTNDTHSIIEPYFDNNLGGVARRKALIDSVRNVEQNVLLVDAGDAMQGSLYFTLFEGEVEKKVMNELVYDIQILGNHEFDNGMDKLRAYVSGLDADLISTNYDLSSTALNPYFKPYVVKSIGSRRIGFIGINIDPHGLIDSVKCVGVGYLDPFKSANAVAWYLKKIVKVDAVVAITHIGYNERDGVSDVKLAESTENIDVIIGGHSHTLINPALENSRQLRFKNVNGHDVLVAQTGKYGANVGEIVIDFANNTINSKIHSVTSRFDDKLDEGILQVIAPYKGPVDSICNFQVGKASGAFDRKSSLLNWMADFVYTDAKRLTDEKIDLSLVNAGGVRSSWPKGAITKGGIMQSFPFDNYEVVLEISGANLIATLDSIAAHGGNGVSRNVSAVISPKERCCKEVTIDGKPIDPSRTYRVATINYLASGNDHMDGLKYGVIIARSENYLYNDIINAFETGWLRGKTQIPDDKMRMIIVE